MSLLKGPKTRTSIRKTEENRTDAPVYNHDYSNGDARRELESTRHSKEPHVVVLPPCDTEDEQHSRVPVPSVGVQHSASNPLTDVLPQSATDALDEAMNARHAHVDRAHKGASIQK
jgi:hypothetical protein